VSRAVRGPKNFADGKIFFFVSSPSPGWSAARVPLSSRRPPRDDRLIAFARPIESIAPLLR
jgi:hypothetical protein